MRSLQAEGLEICDPSILHAFHSDSNHGLVRVRHFYLPAGVRVLSMSFPPELLAQHIAIVGKTGSGKTYTAKGLVETLLADQRRVCVLDPTGVWWGLRSSADGQAPGFPVAVFGGAHADVPIAENSGEALASIIAGRNLPAVIDLSEMLIGQRHRFVTDFAEGLYRDNRLPLHLVIDEADEFCPQNPLPETKRMLHHIDRIVRRGRVRGFRVTLITQRPAVLHKNVLTQANTLIAMRLTAPQDRNALKAWVEGQADAAQAKAVFDSLARLPRGEGWLWAPELDILRRQAFPAISTFDSGRTPEDGDTDVQGPAALADVDLTEICEALAAAAPDPDEPSTEKALRAELAKLRRELADRPTAAPGDSGPMVAALRQELDAAIRARATMELVLNGWHDRARKIAGQLLEAVGDVAVGTTNLEKLEVAAARNVVRAHAVEAPAPAPRPAASVEGLRSGAVRILQELAARYPAGYSRPQVGALTQFAHKGGTFSTYYGDLRRLGFIEERGGLTFATEAGIRSLGDKVPAAPKTHAEVMAMWRRALRSGAFAMLEAIVRAGRAGIHRNELASAVGMAASGGTFATYLGDLRRNGLITEEAKRSRANEILFPKGKT